MSNARKCVLNENGWHLIKREDRLELWHHVDTDIYTVDLYPNVGREERFLLSTRRNSRERAEELFEEVLNVLS